MREGMERERERKKRRAARDATIIQRGRKGQREGCARDGSSTVIGASIFFLFFFFFFTTRESLGIKRFDRFSSVWKQGLEFSFLPRNLPNNIRRIKFPRFLNEFASRELVQKVREKGETAKKLQEEGGGTRLDSGRLGGANKLYDDGSRDDDPH